MDRECLKSDYKIAILSEIFSKYNKAWCNE